MPNEGEKKRSHNFTESESQILIKLCNKYKNVIECKKTDAITNKDKENAWQKITRQYHAACMESSRTTRQLQEKYKAIKKKLKSDYSKNSAYVRGTGGGPYVPPPTPKTDDEKELYETIKLSAEGMYNQFDGDGLSGAQGMVPEDVSTQGTLEMEKDYEDFIDIDFASASAKLWQTPKHPSLTKKNIPAKNIYSLDITDNGDTTTQEILMETSPSTSQNVFENEPVKDTEEWNQPSTSNQQVEGTEIHKDDKQIDNETNNKRQNWQSRRRPVIKKRKTVSSAGGKFEMAAERKIELIEYQKKVAEIQLKQNKEEHQLKMDILKIKKDRESLKNEMIAQGNLTFEF